MKKKNFKKILLLFMISLTSVGLIKTADAAASYYVVKTSNHNFLYTTVGNAELRVYQASINGQAVETYCVDPGKSFVEGYYTVDRYLDPSTDKAVDKAVAAALYEMQTRKANGLDDTSYTAIGQLVMRWIFRQYDDAGLKNGYVPGGELATAYAAFGNVDYAQSINGNTTIIDIAKEVFEVAKKAANTPYQEAVNQNLIYSPHLTASYVEYQIGSTSRKWRVSVQSSEEAFTPEVLGEYAEHFEISCTNTTVTCTVNSKTAKVEPSGVVLEVTIDTTNWNGQDFGMQVSPAYCDPRDATTQIALLNTSNNPDYYQRMIAIVNSCGPSPITPTRTPPSRPRIPVDKPDNSNSCACEVDQSGNYTGNYLYRSYKDGKLVDSITFSLADTDKANQYGCPAAETCQKAPDDNTGNNCACLYSGGKWTGQYSYLEWRKQGSGLPIITNSQILNQNQITSDMNCPSAEECQEGEPDDQTENRCVCAQRPNGDWYYQYLQYRNGQIINQIEFPLTDQNQANVYNCPSAEECTSGESHICEIENGQHYCEDGEPCSEEEYLDQCGCREENGNYYCEDGESCSFDEYKDQCLPTNCYPTVTIPSDCQDIENNTNGNDFNGIVSDINQIETSCNPDTNQVKSCVIDSNDLLNNSFDATEYEMGYDNPYCSVWCNETYKFDLPTAQYTMSGGYFTLSLDIQGTRDCYISGADNPEEGIDREKFNQDLANAQHAVIDAWNEYNFWKEAAAVAAKAKDGNECSKCDSNPIIYTKKWDGILYDYDGGKHDNSDTQSWTAPNGVEYKGTYSSGKASECGTTEEVKDPVTGAISGGDKTCSDSGSNGDDPDTGTGEDGDVNHNKFRDAAKEDLIEAINALNNIIKQYNDCAGQTISNSSDLYTLDVSEFSSTGWDNDMKFDPKVEFTYYEDYLKNIGGTFSGSGSPETSSDYFSCTGDVDEQYGNCTGQTGQYQADESILTCDEDGCSRKNIKINQASRVKISKTYSNDYHSDTDFSTYTQYGTIKVDSAGNNYLLTDLPDDAFPISLIRKTGVFPFKFTFLNIGQFNNGSNAGKLGRLMNGTSKSVITEIDTIPPYFQCNADGIDSPTTTGGYVCHYINNCPGCDFTCEEGECTIDEPECEDGECIIRCDDDDNCVFIFDGDDSTYTYRIVSLNKLFPNEEREAGYNWSNTNEKAAQTREEIERAGETAYETPQYSFTLSPSNLQHIRQYNKEVGSYTNTTTSEGDPAIVCDKAEYSSTDLNGNTNTISYNVRCQSSFLDLIESSGNRYATNVVRPDPDAASSWTLYEVKNGVYSYGIGPAWK